MRGTVWWSESEIIELATECGLKDDERELFLDYLDSDIGDWLGLVVEHYQDQESEKHKQ